MLFLSLNPGSTNTKFSLYDEGKELLNDQYEGEIKDLEKELQMKGFSLGNIHHFGIRIVHGGTQFSKPTQITPTVLTELHKLSELAPLHNPPAIRLIEQLLEFDKHAKIYGVFDTAFHRTIDEKLTRYPIPKKMADEFQIQKFGFHGIACQSVVSKLKKTGTVPEKLIICHLGGGASVTAVKDGKSADTSMGFTPLEGLMMVTRSGDIDAGAVSFLQEKLHLTEPQIIELLNKKSGILGMTGTTDIKTVFEGKTELHKLAREMFLIRVIKHIFAAAGVLGGADMITLSGGIGFHNRWLQEKIQESISPLGKTILLFIDIDEAEEIQRQVAEIL
jgi:acetate kinase